jgi:hypothetical protein
MSTLDKRNEFLEMDGLYWESETHEWFHDKTSTQYAQSDNGLNKDALKNIFCFVVRSKETGEYDRIMMDSETHEIIFDTKSLEVMAFEIDKLKVMKRFNV